MRARLATLALGLALACLSGCSQAPPPYHLQSITGLMPPLEFQLTDDDGRGVTAERYRGSVVLLYFGYTHCPDVCPATLARLGQALRRLGPAADGVRVLFVSVDPARDSGKALAAYAAYFGPQVMGLTGTDDELTALTKRYRVAYRRDAPDARGDYAVYHSSAVFIFDRGGRARLLATPTETADQLAEDLRAVGR